MPARRLQFIVLKWAEVALNLDLSKASLLQGVTAIGIAIGAVLAAKMISLRRSVRVIPLGVAMGLVVIGMNFVRDVWIAVPLLILVGSLAGFFVVPMNALLQHRGHILMGAGHSIAVQNFNENLSILIMTGLYALLIWANLSVFVVITAFGLFVAGMMFWVKRIHEANQRERDDVVLLDDSCHRCSGTQLKRAGQSSTGRLGNSFGLSGRAGKWAASSAPTRPIAASAPAS